MGRELAEMAGIPANFLAKIMLTLRHAGIVDATRGLGGGYRMLKNPSRVTLMEVAELFDGINARPGCFMGGRHACGVQGSCSAHSRWSAVCEAYLRFMTETTIADVGAGGEAEHPRLHHLT